jgi:DNA polymerase
MGGPAVNALSDDEIQRLVVAWRKAHPRIKAFWYDIEAAVHQAIADPGKRITVRDIAVGFRDGWLRLKLPSGRYLCYPNTEVIDGKLTYEGVNQYTKKWERLDTYGPKIVENLVQAVARDVLAVGLRRAEDAGYLPVLHVHDEIIAEAPDTPDYSAEGLSALMAANPGWSLGLPLAAAGFECVRYRKD